MLPLELLVNVAGFLAGQNSYGTLANLASTCKLLKGERASTLYETVILDNDRQWWRDGDGLTFDQIFGNATLEQRINFRHTRYSGHSLWLRARLMRTASCQHRYVIAERLPIGLEILFSDHAVVIHKCDMSFREYKVFGNHRDAPCCLNINKPVTASTLVELLSIPLHWRESRVFQHITGVEKLILLGDGEIIGNASGRAPLPLGNSSSHLVICTPPHTAPSPGFYNTLQQIVREIHPPVEACYAAWKKPMRL